MNPSKVYTTTSAGGALSYLEMNRPTAPNQYGSASLRGPADVSGPPDVVLDFSA